MPKLVEVPDVGEVEFPDEMNDDQIVSAIRGFTATPQEPPVADVETPAPAPGISGAALGSVPSPESQPIPFDPSNPEHKRAALESQFAVETLNTMMLPFTTDWFEASSEAERGRAAGEAEVQKTEARQRLDAFTPEQRDPKHPDYAAAVQAAQAFTQAKDRSEALNTRIAQRSPAALAEQEGQAEAAETERQRREFMGETNPFAALINQAASYPMNVAGSVLSEVAPSIGDVGGELMRGGQQFKETASRAPGALGAVARGAGDVAGLVLGNAPGAIKNAASVAFKAGQDAYAQTLAATGNESQAEEARGNAYRDIGIYMGIGSATSRGIQAALPKGITPFRAAVLSGTGAAGANVGTSFAMASAKGEEYGLQQLTADVLMGGVEGVQTGARVKAEQAESVPPRVPTSEPSVPLEVPRAETDVSDIVPAIRVGDEVLKGSPGEAHRDILNRFIEQNPDSDKAAEAAMNFETKENPNFFVDAEGTEYSRQDLQNRFGVTDSQHLAELQQTERQRKLGPGAANIEEFGPPEIVGAWNAKVDEQRAARGLPPLASEARKADETTWDQAEQRMEENPNYASDLVDNINTGKKESVSDTEQAALLREMVRLRELRDQATTRGTDEQTYSPEERASFLEEAKAADERLQRTEEADRSSGTKQGRALRIRRLMAYEDYTLAGLMGKARRAGHEPTPAEVETMKTQADKFQKAKETFEQRQEEAGVNAPIDEAIRSIEAEAAKDPEFAPEVKSLADRIVSRLERAGNAARTRLRGLMSQLGSAPDVSKAPALIKELAIVAASDIAKGAIKFGQWATKMVSEFGEKVKPYLTDAWKQADKDIDAQVAGTRTKKPKEVKAAVTKETAGAAAEQIAGEMKTRVAAGERVSGLKFLVDKLVKTLVRGGVKQREPLVEKVNEVLKTIDPTITPRQTADLISGYGDFKPISKGEVEVKVRDLKQQLQQVSKIEDILAGQPIKKTGVERQPMSDEGRALVKQVNELARQKGVKVTDPATQLKSILGGIETRLTNRIKDLKAEIAKGQKAVKGKTPPPTNAKIDTLRKELADVEALHEATFGKETRQMTDEQKLRAYKTRTESRIKELENRIAKGDFAPRPKKPPLNLNKDPEAVKAKAEMERIKKEFGQKQFQWEQSQRHALRKGVDMVKETLAASRSLITSADISAPLRQGGFLLIGDLFFHPVRVAKQLGSMFKQLVSERAFEKAQAEISLRPNADLYQQSKLYFADMDGKLSAREENMRSTLAERIPIIGRIVRSSNRAYSGFLNRQRADAFDAMVEARGRDNVTPEGAKLIADAVNTLTGRGSIGARNEGAANFLARYLFSPRFLASRFQTVLGKPILGALGKGASAADRAVIAKQYAKFAVGLAGIYGLAQLAGATVEKDPRSSDFGKIRFGQTRIDPLAGLAQVTTLMARAVSGKTKTLSGQKKDVTFDDFARFARSKLAPIPGALLDIRTGKNVIGEKVTPGSVATGLTVPISYQDIGSTFKKHGPLGGMVLSALNLLGASVNTFKTRN